MKIKQLCKPAIKPIKLIMNSFNTMDSESKKLLKTSFNEIEDLPKVLPQSIFLWGSIFSYEPHRKTKIIKKLCDKFGIQCSTDNSWREIVLQTFFKRFHFSHKALKNSRFECPVCEITFSNNDKYFILSDDLIVYLNDLEKGISNSDNA